MNNFNPAYSKEPPLINGKPASFNQAVRFDKDSQPNYSKKSYSHPDKAPEKMCRWQYKFPVNVIRTEEEANACRATILNNPEFDMQINALILLLGKETAYQFLNKVLENQKYKEIEPGHYEKVYY